jgi:DNA-binding NtrC family response regulator
MPEVTETRHGPRTPGPGRPRLGLVPVFTENRHTPLGRGVEVRAPVRLGRDAAAQLRIEDSQISRLHALAAPSAGGLLVTDLGSRNGTFVDGVRAGGAGLEARPGATIRCGRTLVRVVADVGPFLERRPDVGSPLLGGPSLDGVREQVRAVSALGHAVLIEGETGTGKELVARAIHGASRRPGELVALNCAAIPAELVEAELFGHARGAFSGSDRERRGLVRTAHRGTLLLDEVGDLPAAAQAKLLRVIEEHEVRAVGEDRAAPVDVRVLAATNAAMDELVAAGRFRADLLHRIAAWRVRLPPLRERLEDVPLLARHFLGLDGPDASVEAMERLVLWRWPGNVRELRNAVLSAAARATAAASRAIELGHLPALAPSAATEAAAAGGGEDVALRARIETALRLREGNVAQVARDLGCGRPWLYQALHRLGIAPEAFRKR